MKLKVISFNILCADFKDERSVANRAPRLISLLKSCDADVIGLQEYTPLWESYITSALGDEYEIYNVWRGNEESTPILWKKDKFECLKKSRFWFSDTPENMSGWHDNVFPCNRICEYAVLQDKQSKKCFTFMNTHLGFGDELQVKCVRLLTEYANKISEFPTLVTGDFNMTPYSPAYSEMTKSFVDVSAGTDKADFLTTHNYEPEIRAKKPNDFHIDYCFVKNGATPLLYGILDQRVDGLYPSDHFGLYIELDT